MKTEVIAAGHGGQGVLELANWFAYFYLVKGWHVAYTPSYGPETRGGKVKCYVVCSDERIDSPVVEEPDLLVVMNIPSMDFVPLLKPGGTLVVNSSLVKECHQRHDVKVIEVPATDIAGGLGKYAPQPGKDTTIAANSVMFGACLAVNGVHLEEEREHVRAVFAHFLVDRKAVYIPLNLQAVEEGYRAATQSGHTAPIPSLRPHLTGLAQ